MQIASWNVNSLTVRLPHVLDWLRANPVDVLGLQELKMVEEKFPHEAFAELGYQCAVLGQKTYNGVALMSRHPLADVVKNNPLFPDEQARLIAATVQHPAGAVRVIDGYFVNGQELGSDKFAYKMRWLDALRAQLQTELAAHEKLALLGDFNITTDDRDTYDPEGLREAIHHSSAERTQLQAIFDLGLVDTFRCFEQPERSYSWWDYRNMAFRRKQGLRIDYVLASRALQAKLKACTIDTAPRRLEKPSDHAPVVSSFAL
jgi:exodeoxyribonuclease-3